jgi:hypothetical protein
MNADGSLQGDVIAHNVQAFRDALIFLDPRVNLGRLFTRVYRWRFAPRNLMWRRSRV